jgi:hypothetical protein
MNSTLSHVNYLIHRAALNVLGIILLAVTSCVVFPFFLLVVTVGMAIVGTYAFRGGRWGQRHGKVFTMKYGDKRFVKKKQVRKKIS